MTMTPDSPEVSAGKCAAHTREMLKAGEVGGGVCKTCGCYIFEGELKDDGGELG